MRYVFKGLTEHLALQEPRRQLLRSTMPMVGRAQLTWPKRWSRQHSNPQNSSASLNIETCAMAGSHIFLSVHLELLWTHQESCTCRYLYKLDQPIKGKIEAIAASYGASSVEYTSEAEAQVERYTKQGFDTLPICIAKTQYSFSADASAKGAPSGFSLPVREVCKQATLAGQSLFAGLHSREPPPLLHSNCYFVLLQIRASIGAGFLVVLVGDMPTIPGLPTRPAFFDIDIDANGTIVGLS